MALLTCTIAATSSPAQQTEKPTADLVAILEELRAIRRLLERTAPPAAEAEPVKSVTLPALEGPFLGSADAPLTMVEFNDLQCPFCQRYAVEVFDRLKTDWIETGRLRYFVRDFPLDFHGQARNAAHAVRCAAEQSRASEMRTLLLKSSSQLSEQVIRSSASTLGMNASRFADCQASGRHTAAIDADLRLGATLGINGTPTFLLGRTSPDAVTGVVLIGVLPYDKLSQQLQAQLTVQTPR